MGEAHGAAKLTTEQVLDIRERAQGDWTVDDLAYVFRLSESHVKNIIGRRRWKHI